MVVRRKKKERKNTTEEDDNLEIPPYQEADSIAPQFVCQEGEHGSEGIGEEGGGREE